MLQNIVGSSLMGTTDLKSSTDKMVEKGFKGSSSETSFGSALNDKLSSKAPKKEIERKPLNEDKPESKEASNQKVENKAEQTVVKPKTKKAADRSQAIKEFMDSFESEFEIPSTRLVEAMAQLDKKALSQSPEETADAVIDKLGLDDGDAEKAREMYASLLQQLNQPKEQQPKMLEFSTGAAGIAHQQFQQRMLADQNSQNALSNSIENLNKKFWSSENAEVKSADFLNEIPPHLRGQMNESISPELLAELAAKRAEKADVSSQEIGDESSLVEEFQQVAGKSAEEVPQEDRFKQSLSSQKNSADLMGQNSDKNEETVVAKPSTEKKTEFKPLMMGMDELGKHSIKGEMFNYAQPVAAGATAVPTVYVNHADEQATIKQVMNQAKFLVNKGGGEMNVQLTPEGMGTIHMKVVLQDGKVNLQMSADTAEAKKTIESSLSELKTNLASHKLSMDNVKVDVVGAASSDTATQNQTNNQNGHGQRDQTRQFWNQFNDNFGSQGRRESFAEMPNLKGYGQKERDPLKPIEVASKARARQVDGKGSGLNLVA